MTDIEATFDGDPAAADKEEIIFAYPGLFAIFVYRIAHELYLRQVPMIPRMMTEYGPVQRWPFLRCGLCPPASTAP